jgi:predicted nucleotidyltransferase
MFHVKQNLSNEIILLLLQGGLHTRGLAERLHTNHMTVARKLRELVEENVLDHRTEGKNKVYFLKKSIEARNAVSIAELYKLSQVVSRYPVLRGIVNAIKDLEGVQLALLYGSYAKGLAAKESDIDIYLETSDPAIKKQLEQKNSLLSIKIGAFDTKSPLIQEIIKDHVVIKGSEVYVDKTGFFEK